MGMARLPGRAALLLLLVGALLVSPPALAFTDRGIVYVDDTTLHRIIDGSKHVFIRFDKEYAWGDDHNAFKQLAVRVGESDVDDLVIAALPISKREYEKENMDLAARYGVPESSYPAFKLWRKGEAARTSYPANYTGAIKTDDMLAWIVSHTGVFFGLKGQIKELDQIARSVGAGASEDARTARASQAKKLLALLQASTTAEAEKVEHAQYYVKVFEKLVGNPSFASEEAARLRKLQSAKETPQAKKDSFQVKLNILASFTAATNNRSKSEL